MKRNLLNILLISGFSLCYAGQLFAQDEVSYSKSLKDKKYALGLSFGEQQADRELSSGQQDSLPVREAYKGRFLGGLTLTRIDIGFSRLIDNGRFSLSPKNDFLDYKDAKTSTFSFDLVYLGYRFNPNFKVYVAGGFDWTLIRLKKDITIQRHTPDLTATQDGVHFSKNRLSSSYVHIPLNFEFRTKENSRGKRFYFIAGPEVSFLLNGKLKQISDERGKQKFKDDYHFQPVRWGGSARIGYGGIGLFTKYYFNDMFDTDAQKGVKNIAFGVTFGLN